jgi:hypothetical protein
MALQPHPMTVERVASLKGYAARGALALALLAGGAAPGLAFVVTAAQRAACEPDVFRLCSAAIPDVGKIITCMKQNKPNLTPACRAVVEAAEQEIATRSMVPAQNLWCHFDNTPQTTVESNWMTWCGPAAQH